MLSLVVLPVFVLLISKTGGWFSDMTRAGDVGGRSVEELDRVPCTLSLYDPLVVMGGGIGTKPTFATPMGELRSATKAGEKLGESGPGPSAPGLLRPGSELSRLEKPCRRKNATRLNRQTPLQMCLARGGQPTGGKLSSPWRLRACMPGARPADVWSSPVGYTGGNRRRA